MLPDNPTFDAALFTPAPESWTYPQQPRRDGVREYAHPMADLTPQVPHRLEPRLRLDDEGQHRHLWTLAPEGLCCYHCAWSYRAVLARAKALKEGEVWRQ